MYKHKTSIIGRGGRPIGHMRGDSVRGVGVNRSGVRVDTRKGKRIVWHWVRPLSVVRHFISE